MESRANPDAPVFVMPHFGDSPSSCDYLEAAVDSVLRQTEDEWRLIIVDDNTPERKDRTYLAAVAKDTRIQVVSNAQRLGPGPSRNTGIALATRAQAPFVLFLDSDDVASPDRLSETRTVFLQDSSVDIVYSLFEPMDSVGCALDPAVLSPSIQVILDALALSPPTGVSAWIDMATTYGYCNLTSTTSVRTKLAAAVPFPHELVSDDMHTWFRYGGYGGSFYCIPRVTCGYRIPDTSAGSSCRRRFGAGFYREKARVDSAGFELAIGMAVAGQRLSREDVPALRLAFRARLAKEIAEEGEHHLAAVLLRIPADQQAVSL